MNNLVIEFNETEYQTEFGDFFAVNLNSQPSLIFLDMNHMSFEEEMIGYLLEAGLMGYAEERIQEVQEALDNTSIVNGDFSLSFKFKPICLRSGKEELLVKVVATLNTNKDAVELAKEDIKNLVLKAQEMNKFAVELMNKFKNDIDLRISQYFDFEQKIPS